LLREEGAFASGIDDLFVVGVCELCNFLGKSMPEEEAATVEL